MSNFEGKGRGAIGDLPMPPDNEYAIHLGNFFRLVWDTRGIPLEQEGPTIHGRESVIITPQVGRLVIYGRMIKSTYREDWPLEQQARERGRVMGEWFSTACPQGELGSQELAACEQITAAEFSAAYQRGWEED